MVSLHALKTWPDAFQAVWGGEKVHELRKDDRGFERGDLLDLHEWDPLTEAFTRRHIMVVVTHITKAGEFPGLQEGYVTMSLKVTHQGEVAESWYDTAQHLFGK